MVVLDETMVTLGLNKIKIKINSLPHISNFEKLCELLEKFNNSTEEDSIWIIQEMIDMDGYDDWLQSMEEHRPNDLL